MASWQTYYLNALLRLTVKRNLSKEVDIEVGRKLMEKVTKYHQLPHMVRRLPDTIPATNKTPDLPMEWIDYPGADQRRILLYLHGGAYVMGSPSTHRDLTWRLGRAANARVAAIDYRKAPENPYPAAVDDAEAAYKWLLDQGYDPRSISIGGDSAGGGLALTLLLRIKSSGLPQPAAAIALSPWTDLTMRSDSMKRLAILDPMLNAEKATLPIEMYVGENDPHTPEISPLYGDLSDLCPILIHVGTREVIMDDSTRFAARVKAAGGQVRLRKWHAQPHVFQAFARRSPEGRQSIEQIGQFIRLHSADLRNSELAA